MKTSKIFKTLNNIFSRRLTSKTYIIKNFKGEIKKFSTNCPVCMHPDRFEIDNRINLIEPLQEIAEKYNLKLKDLIKHSIQHLDNSKQKQSLLDKIYRQHFTRYIDLEEELLKLVDRLNILFSKLEKFDEQSLDRYRNIPTPRDYIASISERRKIIEEIRQTLYIINKLKTEVKNEKDLTELLENLQKASNPI